MLTLYIDGKDFYDENKEEFVKIKPQRLVLEHSLLSISKWESRWKKPFLSTKKNSEEQMDYIKCMTVSSQVNPLVYDCLTIEDHLKIKKYMNDSMTATKINRRKRTGNSNRYLTNELIYCWMFSLNIPIDCEKWHINRLLTLIEVTSIENNPKNKRKMSRQEIYNQNAALNAARRAKYNTRG